MTVIPEQFVEELRGCVALEDTTIFETCRKMHEGWIELGQGIAYERNEDIRSAHKFFIESCASEVNMHPTSMYDRERVGSNIMARGLLEENMSYSVCTALLRNTSRDENGMIPEEEVKQRIEWYQDEAVKFHGKPPSPRDIQDHFRRNGDQKEWEVLWQAIVRNAKQIRETEDAPNILRNALHHIEQVVLPSSTADADYTGGMNQARQTTAYSVGR